MFANFLFILFLYQIVAAEARNMKKGTHAYHVGVSAAGMNAVWRQGTAKPESYQYSFSFMAYERQEKGTIPFAVTYSKNVSNEGCFIDEMMNENANFQPDFIFWAYPDQMYKSKLISLTSKLRYFESFERQYYDGISSKSIGFWSPSMEKGLGNFHLISYVSIIVCRKLLNIQD